MNKPTIAVFGGSFDPPTLAHQLVIAELLNQKMAESVILVPCGNREDKALVSGEDRC